MRSNIVSEASLSTRIGQWWAGVPFITSGLVIVCGIIYLICLLIGYDSYYEICFWPAEVASKFQCRILQERHPTLFWSPCAAHVLDLILEDIGKLDCVSPVVEDARRVTKYIYNHPWVLSLMRKTTKGKDLVRLAMTRFAMVFLMLQSILDHILALKQMFVCADWVASSYSKKPEGEAVAWIVFDESFFAKAKEIVEMSLPLVLVLRICDGKQSPMGGLYEAMDRAKEAVRSYYHGDSLRFDPIWEIIDRRWNNMLHKPIHAAGYFLNPKFRVDNSYLDPNGEVMEGLSKCIERMISNEAERDIIMTGQQVCVELRGNLFSSMLAKRARSTQALVYRIYTSVLFHGSVLHVMFNMLALVPIGSGLERIMGSVRYLHVTLLVATCNAVLHLLVAYLAAHNPLYPHPMFMDECTIGFSGIIFAMIVIETSLNGNQSRSVFGLFNVPGKWYAWILLILFQLLMPNVSFLGHLCGILTGFAYTYGLLNYLILGSSSYAAIESSAMLAFCVRRPRFIVGGSGGSVAGPDLPFSSASTSGTSFGNVWRHLRSWLPQREFSAGEPQQDSRFPGRGRSLGSVQNQLTARFGSNPELQTRLLERSTQPQVRSEMMSISTHGMVSPNVRPAQMESFLPADSIATDQVDVENHAEAIQNLVAMGFEKSKAEVALVAANGDVTLAVELLSSPER